MCQPHKINYYLGVVPVYRAVTKISSCRVNTTSRRGIKRLVISFGSIFLPFSYESSRGGHVLSSQGTSLSPPLNDNPEFIMCTLSLLLYAIVVLNVYMYRVHVVLY